ncbi:ComEC/Rec2 family competence protein [Flavobacterium silvaticum]|uniref:ComEC family competence protein n=1 Tax=Flavobacterium silvaticum TaxID=1852020 RepID=A0A972FJM4_9FLAO|nr:ComEC/Rec2 family competence protein [Flavobacterium silvaticum]NMH27181.1 ComEC family competence protein [Flavobacterium silvaticum]
MTIFNYPLPKLCLAVIFGILCYNGKDIAMTIVFGALLLGVSILGLSYFYKRDKNIHFSFCCLLVAFISGFSTAAIHDPARQITHYKNIISDNMAVVHGVVSDRLRPGIMAERYYLQIEGIDTVKAVGKLLLYVKDAETRKLQTGERIAFRSEIKPIRKPLNPGQFDYATYLSHKKVFASASVNRDELIRIGSNKKDIFYYADRLRNTIDNRLSKSNLKKEELAVLNALILGQQQDISKDILTDYQFAGAVHILSVSGLHVGFLMLFLRFLFNLLPQSKFNRFLALISTLMILWLFAVVAGLSASVVRSVVMFSFLSLALYSNRDYSGFHGLFISMLLILWVEPDFLYDAGFQLSYLALLAILWFQPILNKIWKPKNVMLRNMRDLASVSIAAQLGTLPLSLYYFHQFPGLFLITNLVIIPAVGIIMAIGSLTVVWAIFSAVPEAIIWLTQNSIGFLNKTIRLIASIDSARFTEIFFPASLLIVAYIFLLFMVWWLEKPKRFKLMLGLSSLVVFQIVLITDLAEDSNKEELIVFHSSRKSILAEWQGSNVIFYADSCVPPNLLSDYSKLHQRLSTTIRTIPNCLISGKSKILIIDSLGNYPTYPKPDILLITGSPKINIDRMLEKLRPYQLIVDGGNYPGFVKNAKQSCRKQKIPFHATAEKGSFMLSF